MQAHQPITVEAPRVFTLEFATLLQVFDCSSSIATLAMAAESPEAAPKKKFQLKKPLFSRPTWASPKPVSSNEDIFSRSNKSYGAIAEEEAKRRKRKEEKAAKKKEDRLSDGGGDEHKDKKQRTTVIDSDLSVDEEEDETTASEAEEVKTLERSRPRSLSSKSASSPRTPTKLNQGQSGSPIKPSSAIKQSVTPQPEIIDIHDSDDDDDSPQKPPQQSKPFESNDDDNIQITSATLKQPAITNEEDEPSDDEFAELARQAREKAYRKRFDLDETPSQSNPATQPTLEPSVVSHENSFAAKSETPQPPQDPVISILITSRLPGTDHLIVKRRLNQRLRDVRIAWCSRQGFEDLEASGIILMFRGRRVFDVNTCRSLGIGVDEQGEVVMEGEKDAFGEADRRIHMEAMTEEMYSELQEEEARKARQEDDELEEIDAAQAEKPKQPERQTRIILKAKGLADFKLIVKDVSAWVPSHGFQLADESLQSTTISQITNVFGSERNIDEHRFLHLMFDGERLDPEMTVAQTEISDMDNIEVYVR